MYILKQSFHLSNWNCFLFFLFFETKGIYKGGTSLINFLEFTSVSLIGLFLRQRIFTYNLKEKGFATDLVHQGTHCLNETKHQSLGLLTQHLKFAPFNNVEVEDLTGKGERKGIAFSSFSSLREFSS